MPPLVERAGSGPIFYVPFGLAKHSAERDQHNYYTMNVVETHRYIRGDHEIGCYQAYFCSTVVEALRS